MEDKIKAFPEKEEKITALLDGLHTDREALRKLTFDPETKRTSIQKLLSVTRNTRIKRKPAKAFEGAALSVKYADTPVKIGSFQGFDLSVTIHSEMMGGRHVCHDKRVPPFTARSLLKALPITSTALNRPLYNIDGRIASVKDNLAQLRIDYSEAQKDRLRTVSTCGRTGNEGRQAENAYGGTEPRKRSKRKKNAPKREKNLLL